MWLKHILTDTNNNKQNQQEFEYTGHTQTNGAVLIVFTINTAPFFCVCPVHTGIHIHEMEFIYSAKLRNTKCQKPIQIAIIIIIIIII